MHISKILFAAFASMAVASTAPVLAQDPHGHDATGQSSTPVLATPCAPGSAASGMHGGMGQMQGMDGQHMMQMMQSMEQMHEEMQQMRKEMRQMRQEMLQRRTK